MASEKIVDHRGVLWRNGAGVASDHQHSHEGGCLLVDTTDK